MTEETQLVEDAYEAMRIAAAMADDDPRQAQLSSYVDVMASAGFGVLDRVTMETLDAKSDDDPKYDIVVNWNAPSDLWRSAKRNINKNGLFIQVEPAVQMGDTVNVQVQMQSPSLSFDCLSKVIWASPQERSGRPMGIGVKFLWDEDKTALFKRFVKGEIDPMELKSLSDDDAAAAETPADSAEAPPAADDAVADAALVDAAVEGAGQTPAA